MDALAPFGAILALAFLCESLTEYFFSDLLPAIKVDAKYLRYLSAGVGVTLALLYGLDGLKTLFGITAQVPWVGEVLTGLLLGRGANYVHDFYGSYVRRGV